MSSNKANQVSLDSLPATGWYDFLRELLRITKTKLPPIDLLKMTLEMVDMTETHIERFSYKPTKTDISIANGWRSVLTAYESAGYEMKSWFEPKINFWESRKRDPGSPEENLKTLLEIRSFIKANLF
ncbi:MAG: hypothetical protein EOP06_25485 [Proteobacteria bacterium]|nr:MAG: hypothetical protein EOP06_25485 [Pseudomonadota bacterium]